MAAESQRLVRYSPRADEDLVSVYDYTTQQHGVQQAEKYLKFLLDHGQDIADKFALIKKMDHVDGTYLSFTKWPGSYYGHHFVFQYEETGIYVLRVLHSASESPIRGADID